VTYISINTEKNKSQYLFGTFLFFMKIA